MMQDVMAESRPNMQNTASYFGQPYFWGMLETFGAVLAGGGGQKLKPG